MEGAMTGVTGIGCPQWIFAFKPQARRFERYKATLSPAPAPALSLERRMPQHPEAVQNVVEKNG
jgi:hypothetical protein